MSLKTEVSLIIYEDLVRSVKLFEFGEPSFIMATLRYLKPKLYMKGDYVIRKDEYADNMYFIRSGYVKVLASDEDTIVAILHEGDYFGEIGILLQERRSLSVKAGATLLLSAISKADT
jgi:CRP-like cAMP-binding protein